MRLQRIPQRVSTCLAPFSSHFTCPQGATLSRLGLAAGGAFAHAGSSAAQNADPLDAAPSQLLDSAADGQSRLLGRGGALLRLLFENLGQLQRVTVILFGYWQWAGYG